MPRCSRVLRVARGYRGDHRLRGGDHRFDERRFRFRSDRDVQQQHGLVGEQRADSTAAPPSPSPASSRNRRRRRARALRWRARAAPTDRRWPRGRSGAPDRARPCAAHRACGSSARGNPGMPATGAKYASAFFLHQVVGDARGDGFVAERRARRQPFARERRHGEPRHQLRDARSRDAERRALRRRRSKRQTRQPRRGWRRRSPGSAARSRRCGRAHRRGATPPTATRSM